MRLDNNNKRKSVAVFIDVPNMSISANSQDTKFDAKELMAFAKQLGRVKIAKAYLIIKEGGPTSIISVYEYAGFIVVLRHTKNYDNGTKDVDTHLVTDMLRSAYENNIDTFLMAAGDGDYIPAIDVLREIGKDVIVIGVNGCYSRALANHASQFISYDEMCDQNVHGISQILKTRAHTDHSAPPHIL